ncbi:MAG: MiaB/RimO family radical SAM methylthiotransferase, partial [Coriobacteriia bacterium]|nr:MiaB/RimO family radical SAM methylthiotransferase [Coriobacteriia bacterium]
MRALVASSAYEVASDLDSADIAIVITCGFIKPAVEESIEAIFELAEWRDQTSGRHLVVAGCLPSRYGVELETSLTEVDAFIPVAEEASLLDVLERLTSAPGQSRTGPVRTDAKPSAYLQISDGCSRHCSYCTIPSIRGPYRSRALGDIANEARQLVESGAKEIVLIGQDTGAYGRDLDPDTALPDVLRTLSDIDDLAWLRIMYLQPEGVSDRLLDTMATLPKVCRYADMPLQHVVPEMLEAMNRSGSADEYLALIGRVREAMPDIALRTSLIAGFPGEKDADVEALLAFLREADFDYVGVFPFSPEEGTPAAALPHLPPE